MTPAVGYTEMRDSGIEWVGMIPKDWDINILFQLVSQVKNKNKDLAETNLLSLSYGKIKRKNIDHTDGLIPASFDSYNIIDTGDIVLRLTDLQNDQTSLRVGRSTEKGIITSAYITLRPVNHKTSKFLYYLLHAFDIRKGFYGMGAGVRQGLTYDEVKVLKLPLPSISEQTAIATYLDTQCAKIDEIIAEAKASIEDYKQWKASIIYEAVTKGLDPKAEMKDSGIEWIGEIPKSVSCSFVGKHFEITLGKMLCNSPDNDQYTLEPYYCAANVHFSGILCDDLKEMWFSPLDKRKYLAQSGDLLVVEGGAGAGGSFVLSEQDKIAYFQNSILRVRPKRDNNVRYLKYLIEALVTQDYINYVCNRATIPHFTKEKLSATPFLVFSGIQQKGIADHLDDVCAKIDKIISQKQSLVFDLESYKKSLIYEVVTGKRRAC
jgi:hypothetical protein ELI_1147